MRSRGVTRRLALAHDVRPFRPAWQAAGSTAPRWSPAAGCTSHQPGERRASSPRYALATPADVDAAVASARAALPGWATATPVERSAVLAKLAELAGAARRATGRRGGQPDRKAGAVGRRVRRAGQHRQHRLLRRRGPPSRGQGQRGVFRRSHVEHPARGRRRRRNHHAVELPAADGGVEGVACVGRRVHGRDQPARADAADDADAGPAGQRGRSARRRVQRRDGSGRRRRHRAGRASRRRRGDVHRLDRRWAAR